MHGFSLDSMTSFERCVFWSCVLFPFGKQNAIKFDWFGHTVSSFLIFEIFTSLRTKKRQCWPCEMTNYAVMPPRGSCLMKNLRHNDMGKVQWSL